MIASFFRSPDIIAAVVESHLHIIVHLSSWLKNWGREKVADDTFKFKFFNENVLI